MSTTDSKPELNDDTTRIIRKRKTVCLWCEITRPCPVCKKFPCPVCGNCTVCSNKHEQIELTF